MKLLHTADWHLGRQFHQLSLVEDQSFALAALERIVAEERPDAILLAGDVYDRAVPPPEAVALFDRTLGVLAVDQNIPLIIIPGNHDSATRLGFGAGLMSGRGVHIVSTLERALEPITLTGADGSRVNVFALPYTEPPAVRQFLKDETIRDHDGAMAALCDRMKSRFVTGERQVLVAHAFVSGGRDSESERPLSVGGAGTVSAAHFSGFDYVALGHLHSPQSIGEVAVYSGSLLKYSFSECADAKSVTIVEIPARGAITRRTVPLSARRDVRRIEGELKPLIAAAPDDPGRDDYLHVTLTDDGALLNAMARLREAYPNALHLERRFLEPATGSASRVAARRTLSDADLFRAFCREVLGADATDAQVAAFGTAADSLRTGESS